MVEERHEPSRTSCSRATRGSLELNDGYAAPGFASAGFRVAAAEALIPAPRP